MLFILVLLFLSIDIFPCSIVGCTGNNTCKTFLLDSLSRLEYRGYDSAGIALLTDTGLSVTRKEGVLSGLVNIVKRNNIDGFCGIGHTRWATHGKATEANAHPHTNGSHSIAVVHNGIIENFFALKLDLQKRGFIFRSETDTEVIAHLIDSEMLESGASLLSSVTKVVNKLEGAFAILVIGKNNNEIIAARKGSPLCIGVGKNENFVASDCLAFHGKTSDVAYLPEKTIAHVSPKSFEAFDFDGNRIEIAVQHVNADCGAFDLIGYKHFMLKEIYEQATAISNSIDFLEHANIFDDCKINSKELKTINIIGCGTSWHAARIAQFFFEEVAKIPTRIYLASEFRYMPFFPEENSLYVAISQSGETADTLEAIRMVNKHNLKTLAITNVSSSTMARECSGYVLSRCGPEISVAATKSFTAQLSSLYCLAYLTAESRGLITKDDVKKGIREIKDVAVILGELLEKYRSKIKENAKKYCHIERFIFLGRHIGYPFAMEAALKLKEISYIFALGLPAGELKHGSIALIDLKTPVMLFSHPDEEIYKKILSNAQEIKARDGHVISIAFEDQRELIEISDLVFEIPRVNSLLSTIAMSGIMQLFVYQIADELGCNIDKPRNLAKSVTVE
jgi:glutamine---fructose-6-phosphate transaminase (isomerizing)